MKRQKKQPGQAQTKLPFFTGKPPRVYACQVIRLKFKQEFKRLRALGVTPGDFRSVIASWAEGLPQLPPSDNQWHDFLHDWIFQLETVSEV